jgi:hypothetical protein
MNPRRWQILQEVKFVTDTDGDIAEIIVTSKRQKKEEELTKFDKDVQLVTFQLKYINEHAGEISGNNRDWAIRMETSFNNKGFLSPREMEILKNIYEKL